MFIFPYNEVLLLSIASHLRRVDTLDFDGDVYVDWDNKRLVTKREFRERVAGIKKNLMALTEIESRARERNEYDAEYFSEVRGRMYALTKEKRRPQKKSSGTDLESVKINNRISDFIEFNRANMARCIWHNERTPSMKYYPKDNHVYCFGCNKHGSVIDVVMAQDKCTFLEALKKLTHGGENK